MSGTFPTTGFETLDFQSNVNNRITKSVSGRVSRLRTGAQYWTLKLKSPALTKDQLMDVYSFVAKQDGQYESFTVVPPVISSTRGTMTGTVTVADVESVDPAMSTVKGTTTVGIEDDGTASGTLKKGDIIKFSNHDKVYMLTEDLTLQQDSSVAQMTVYPPLVSDLVGGTTTVVYSSVPITVFLDSDQQKYITQVDGTYRYEIALVEDI